MNRRNFLVTAPAMVASTAYYPNVDGKVLDDDELPSYLAASREPAEVERTGCAVAVFPSSSWGVCARGLQFEDGRLADVQHDLTIRKGYFDLRQTEATEIAIAVANPHDSASWQAAQTQCRLARQAGAWTLLFAAHPAPQFRYPFDANAAFGDSDRFCNNEAHVVISFVASYLKEEFPDIVAALLNYGGYRGRTDVPALRSALGDGARAIYLPGEVRRDSDAVQVTRCARNHLMRLTHAGVAFSGVLALLDGSWIHRGDYHEIYSKLACAVADFVPVTVECTGTLRDEWKAVHIIASYAP